MANTFILLLSIVAIALVMAALVYLIFNVLTVFFFRGIFYVPSETNRIKKMIELANIKPGELACDLGSGDGRLVMALARAGAVAHGYEVNPLLIVLAKLKIRKAGYSGQAFIHWKNFWKEDLSKFDIITIYGMDFVMKRLEEDLKDKMRPGARVVSNGFPFPNWPPAQKSDRVYLYK